MPNSSILQSANQKAQQLAKQSVSRSVFVISRYSFLVIGIAITLYIKTSFFDWGSGDYHSFLKHWMAYMTNNGGILSFKDSFYDYTPLYLYFLLIGTLPSISAVISPLWWIKIVSILFEFIGAFFVAKIVNLKYGNNQEHNNMWQYAFLVFFALPSVIINGSMWGQCDVVFSSFVVGTLYYLLKKKWMMMSITYAIAFCFKSQAIFFAPVFLIVLINRYMPLSALFKMIVSTVFCYLLVIFPAYFVGRPLLDVSRNMGKGLLTIYLNQTGSYTDLNKGATNMYRWINNEHYKMFYRAGIGIAGFAVFWMTWISTKMSNTRTREFIIKTAFLSVTIMPFMLPKMHERYFFLADTMAVVFAFWFPKKAWMSIVLLICSAFSSFEWLNGGGSFPTVLGVPNMALWVMIMLIFLVADWIKEGNSKTLDYSQKTFSLPFFNK